MGGQAAVAVACPFDRKLTNSITGFLCSQDHFHIEHESVRYAGAVKLPRDFAFVDLKAALSVSCFCGQVHEYPCGKSEKLRTHTPIEALVDMYGAF